MIIAMRDYSAREREERHQPEFIVLCMTIINISLFVC